MTRRANWAGNHEFTAAAVVEPSSIAEVQAAVRAGGPVRALGSAHSFSDLADTPGTLISTLRLPADPVLDEDARLVVVGAGTRYAELAGWLEPRGWALHNLGSLPHISIGGAIATGTHGSGNANRALSSAVRSVEFVDHRGARVEVTRDDPRFAGLVIGLGAYGVVVRVGLDVEPAFLVRQDAYTGVRWDDFLADPDAVMGAAYSVSVFARWSDPELEQVWLKSRVRHSGHLGGADHPAAGPLGGRWLAAARDFSAVPGISATFTPQGGVPGSWAQRLPHFRSDAAPSVGDELQSEYFVARSDASSALAQVRELAGLIDPHLYITELRTMAADPLWLSGAFERDALGIHFTWRKEPEAVRAVLPAIETALRPFSARPHWGKVHRYSAEELAHVHPRLDDARTVFEELDPGRRFSNPHLERLGVR